MPETESLKTICLPGLISPHEDIYIPLLPGIIPVHNPPDDSIMLAIHDGYIIFLKCFQLNKNADEQINELNDEHKKLIESYTYSTSGFKHFSDVINTHHNITFHVYEAEIEKKFENEFFVMNILNIYFKGTKKNLYKLVITTGITSTKDEKKIEKIKMKKKDDVFQLMERFALPITKIYVP